MLLKYTNAFSIKKMGYDEKDNLLPKPNVFFIKK